MKKFSFYIGLVLLYSIIFISIYGYNSFNINYIDWIMVDKPHTDGDIPMNFLNFLAFLNSDMQPPFMDNNAYPFITSILYNDCFPLLALLCKIYIKFFVDNSNLIQFQYIWFVGCLNFILQGILSYRIIKCFTKSKINAILCSIFFVLAPPLLFRFPSNYTLTAHYYIFLSYIPFLYNIGKKLTLILWFSLGILAIGTHSYFLPILFINLFAYIVYKLIKKEIDIKNSFFLIISFVLGAFISFLLLGGISSSIDPRARGFRIFSFNLNQLINPINDFDIFKSSLFPFLNELKLYNGFCQMEGFSYLGGGFICLLVLALFLILKKYNISDIITYTKKYKIETIIFLSIFFFVLLLSCSLDITLGENLIISIPLPEQLESPLGIFRASGRFIWNNFYLIYFIAFAFILKHLKPKIATLILIIVLSLQIYDIFPALKLYNEIYANHYTYESKLKDKAWELLRKKKKFLYVHGQDPHIYYWGVKNKFLIFNLLYCRTVINQYEYIVHKLNNPQIDDLFIFPSETGYDPLEVIKNNTKLNYFYFIDNYYVYTSDDIEELSEYKIEIKR